MKVTGSILTDDMAIVPFANVVVVGENRSTQADQDGKFSIDADAYDSVLHFSKVGLYYEELTVAQFNLLGYVNMGFSTENLEDVLVQNNYKSDNTLLIALAVAGIITTVAIFSSNSKAKA